MPQIMTSPTCVMIDDENKYGTKRRRRIRPKHAKVMRLSWTLFGLIYCVGTFFLIYRMALDSALYQERLLERERYQRAQILQEQRQGRKKDEKHKQMSEAPSVQPPTGLMKEFKQLNHDILNNIAGGPRFIRPELLPRLPGRSENPILQQVGVIPKGSLGVQDAFSVSRRRSTMAWTSEHYEERPPKVDYTKHAYQYPELLTDLPPKGYPQLETLGDMLTKWPQNDLDDPPTPFVERLIHFNFSNPVEREAALKFRDAELPFKLYDVREVTAAGIKWTDEYVSNEFDKKRGFFRGSATPQSKGNCQESPNHYFAFYSPQTWHVSSMGPPPVRFNDWTFEDWAKHARYADSVSLSEDRPHFYWQSGVPREERHLKQNKWTFVSRDLPSFSSPEETFFVFHPDEQKGIQCRFGERGVTAATHYDSGRNMVAMVKGAKRYILSPPRECSNLGIVTQKGHTIFRHSLLNFGNINYLDTDKGESMSKEEREWLERAKKSTAVDTVLKAGEVLYIPSMWFHYIISLQKSAQCNVRSGVDYEGTPEFGGAQDVRDCYA